MPETCWDRYLIINIRLVASCWFLFFHFTYRVLFCNLLNSPTPPKICILQGVLYILLIVSNTTLFLNSQYWIKLQSTFCELLNVPQATHCSPVPHFTILYRPTCYFYERNSFTASSSITVDIFHITVVYPTTQYPIRKQHCNFESRMVERGMSYQSTVPYRSPQPVALCISPRCINALLLTSQQPLG